jgi:hypothetical protein
MTDALTRERDARTAAYTAAVEARDAHPGDRRVEARFAAAVHALNFWGDQIPGAVNDIPYSAAPVAQRSLGDPGVADTAEAVAARVLASDRTSGDGHKQAEVDALAARIAAA